MITHHKDNYHIIKQEKSILDGLIGNVRVADDVKKDDEIIETKDKKVEEEPDKDSNPVEK